MYAATPVFRQNTSRAVALTAVFAGLFAIGNFISFPEVGSIEMLVTWTCAGIFGPHVAVVASVAGEALSMVIFPTNPIFIPTKLGGAALTAVIMGYGRRLAFPLAARGTPEKRARMVVESLVYAGMLAARLGLYLAYNALVGIPGYEIVLTVNFIFKIAFLPLGLAIVEAIRRGTGKVYFDLVRVDGPTATNGPR